MKLTRRQAFPPRRGERSSEGGYVLVAALVTLLLLTVLGIWATRTTNLELRTAANERLRQQAFYQADSGDTLAERLIYHNLLCVNAQYQEALNSSAPNETVTLQGFAQSNMPWPLRFDNDNNKLTFFNADPLLSPGANENNDRTAKKIKDGRIVLKTARTATIYDPALDEPSDTNRTFLYCPGAQRDGECNDVRHPRTNVLIGSESAAKKGQGLIQSSGYEGFGVGAANVGFYWTYKIRSQHLGGIDGNESRVNVIWQLSGLNVSQARDEDCHYGKNSMRWLSSGSGGGN